MKRTFAIAYWAGFCLAMLSLVRPIKTGADQEAVGYHVYPEDNIQAMLEQAAADPVNKTVKVHEGTYRPHVPGQALIWFNARHDGIRLEAVGEVVLTAANPILADSSDASYPAIVNHVIYFGDGISRRTVLSGFKITGANHFVTRSEDPGPIQPETAVSQLVKDLFFYADGGGIKIFGRSYPTIENVEVYDNYTSPCGGGVSVEHRGFNKSAVLFRNCVFRNNRCQTTGSAIDVLPNSSAMIENCLFIGNVSNTGVDEISQGEDYNGEHGSGALTVFPGSRVRVNRSTFTGNRNGVDDKGMGNAYINTIFWMNIAEGGISPEGRYEIDILDGRGVRGCFLKGDITDLRGTLDKNRNVLNGLNPDFDAHYSPRAKAYQGAGYRPVAD